MCKIVIPHRFLRHLLVLCFSAQSFGLHGQTTEERFHDMFVTAGYSTAFGAALGAASLSFAENPSSKLRYVAIGASIGFICGSLFGSYLVFAPVIARSDLQHEHQPLVYNPSTPRQLAYRNLSRASSLNKATRRASGWSVTPVLSPNPDGRHPTIGLSANWTAQL